MSRPPTRLLERELLAGGRRYVAGMDEVGRGALAGPVSVGVVVIDADTGRSPAGLRDSKLLRPEARERLCAPIRRWSVASAVGHAGAAEIDRIGIIAALRLAGTRALTTLARDGIEADVVILDGNHDWLSAPADLFTPAAATPPVTTRIKADLTCSVVAAASVLAKCERDAMMRELHEGFPAYGWHGNKGYSAPEHLAALTEHGPCELHRRSWSLPGVDTGTGTPAVAGGGMMDQ
ncbi:ribonuclease HII [Occultella gossypii]|nr:ribonuclease HII [Occultella gossypii]